MEGEHGVDGQELGLKCRVKKAEVDEDSGKVKYVRQGDWDEGQVEGVRYRWKEVETLKF